MYFNKEFKSFCFQNDSKYAFKKGNKYSFPKSKAYVTMIDNDAFLTTQSLLLKL